MKVIWERDDIRSGRVVGNPERAERWMIGYLPDSGKPTLNSMSDGMVVIYESAGALADGLNASRDVPLELLKKSDS